MGAPDLLRHLRDSGFRLDVDGDLLTITPRDRLTDAMRQAIREFKPALLALLTVAMLLLASWRFLRTLAVGDVDPLRSIRR